MLPSDKQFSAELKVRLGTQKDKNELGWSSGVSGRFSDFHLKCEGSSLKAGFRSLLLIREAKLDENWTRLFTMPSTDVPPVIIKKQIMSKFSMLNWRLKYYPSQRVIMIRYYIWSQRSIWFISNIIWNKYKNKIRNTLLLYARR